MGDMADYEMDAEQDRAAFWADEKRFHEAGCCGGEGLCWYCDLAAGTLGDPDSF